jgi:UDPglucose 6-dehydrogenase
VVGTATGKGFAAKGHEVRFCDTSPERLLVLRRQGLRAVDAVELCGLGADAYLISVPTPTVESRIDLSYVLRASAAVGQAMASLDSKPLVVVRSTVPPGTCEQVILPLLGRESGRSGGVDFGLCMNPEFLRARCAEEDFLNPRVIVSGALDEWSDRRLRELYRPWPDVPVHSMSLQAAEGTKYAANLFNAAKISFFNELEQVFDSLGVDARAAFAAAAAGAEGLWNPEYGTRGLSAYGGVCLPKDTQAFLSFAESLGFGDAMVMLRATIETNDRLAAREAAGELGLREPAQAAVR